MVLLLGVVIYSINLNLTEERLYVRIKVEIYKVNEAENKMNVMLKQGWKVVVVTLCPAATWSKDTMVVTLERNKG